MAQKNSVEGSELSDCPILSQGKVLGKVGNEFFQRIMRQVEGMEDIFNMFFSTSWSNS